MTHEEARALARERLRQGHSRGSILRALAMASVPDAARVYSRARVEWLNGNLPGALRAGGKRQLCVGIPAALASCVLTAGLAYALEDETRTSRGATKMVIAMAFALVFVAAQLLWVWSRFRLARRLEREERSSSEEGPIPRRTGRGARAP